MVHFFLNWGVNLVFSYLATVAFAILLNIPRRALNSCGMVGVAGWFVYMLVKEFSDGVMLANTCSAFTIGITAMLAARHHKMPMILFNIPSLVPLVPGGQSYRAVRYFALGNNDLALDYLVQVALIAGAIAVGFVMAEFIAQWYFKFERERHPN